MLAAVALFVREMKTKSEHPLWVITQQVLVRGLLALKFLLAARLLGPEQIGLVGIALLTLSIVEALSDTGLAQAVVQRKTTIDRKEAGALWTLQLFRGIILMLALLALASPIAYIFNTPESASLIAISALIALLRNAINPGLILTQRDRNFRKLSIYETCAASIDFSITIFFIHTGHGPISILFGTIASECFKLLMSWSWLRMSILVSLKWKQLHELTSFGKWVWGSSVVTLFLNQLDKALVAKFLGTTEFGLYQVAARIAQLLVSDGVVALSQYLYPTLSQKFRDSPSTTRCYLISVAKKIIPLASIPTVFLLFFSEDILKITLGPDWVGAAPILRILSVCMLLGACIAILVAYTRAIGRPEIVTQAAIVQLLSLLLAAPIMITSLASVGMALASTTALLISVIYIFTKSIRTPT